MCILEGAIFYWLIFREERSVNADQGKEMKFYISERKHQGLGKIPDQAYFEKACCWKQHN